MEQEATEAAPAAAEGADLGGQVRSAVGRLYRRFRSERPDGGLGDAALAVLSYLHKHGPQTWLLASPLLRWPWIGELITSAMCFLGFSEVP